MVSNVSRQGIGSFEIELPEVSEFCQLSETVGKASRRTPRLDANRTVYPGVVGVKEYPALDPDDTGNETNKDRTAKNLDT